MSELGVVEDTLYVPMLGRIFASENFPKILFDEKALSLKEKLPEGAVYAGNQTQYTYLASATRSANMDRYIKDFLERNPSGVIVQLGVGLETTYWRNDNGVTPWYGVDLPNVIEYRKTLLGEVEREMLISGDAFKEDWIRRVRSEHSDAPILVTASGLFYYFDEEKVLELLRMLQRHCVEIVFDAANKFGINMMKRKYMKQVGHADAKMFFYVDSPEDLVKKIGGEIKIFPTDKYYSHVSRKGLNIVSRVSMNVTDRFDTVMMIHLGL